MGDVILLHHPIFSKNSTLTIEPTEIATWLSFIRKGEEIARKNLHEDLESFLVFTLMRFVKRNDLFSFTLALEYLRASTEQVGKKKEHTLSEVGDVSLILAGLYPERAKKLNVSSEYFSNMGKLAFTELAQNFSERGLHGMKQLYLRAGSGFIEMTEILQATRKEGPSVFTL